MKTISTIHRVVRLLILNVVHDYLFCPIAGRVLDHYLRWCHSQARWEKIVSATAHVLIETSSVVIVRTRLCEALIDFEPFLSQESGEVLRLLDEIAQKHSPVVG